MRHAEEDCEKPTAEAASRKDSSHLGATPPRTFLESVRFLFKGVVGWMVEWPPFTCYSSDQFNHVWVGGGDQGLGSFQTEFTFAIGYP